MGEMTVEEDATAQAMAALETMAALWAAETNLSAFVDSVSKSVRLKESIHALATQCFIEGAYRTFCDWKDGKFPPVRLSATEPRSVEQVAGLLPEGFCVVQIEPKTEADDDLWYDAAMAYREAVRFNQKGFSEECCRISAAIRVLAAGAVGGEGK